MTLHPADAGDTTTGLETLAAARATAKAVALGPIQEAVLDKGYHSHAVLVTLADKEVRSYVSEPKRGRRRWADTPEAKRPVYANRRRLRGPRNTRLQAHRAELCERSHAHLYETGAMRRVHLRGRHNILKRLLIHAAGFNLALLMRTTYGTGTPRGLQGRTAACIALVRQRSALVRALYRSLTTIHATILRRVFTPRLPVQQATSA